MSKLPNLKPREIERILLKAGFERDTAHGSHRSYYHPHRKRHTTIAFHPGTIPQGTLRAILRQADISLEDFLALRRK